MVTADYIVNGLMQRGLPEHVARGFAINMQDESGLNPGINEIAPLVPGSRGGFGLYQLTGPRRKAYEAFAAQRGVDPADPDAQLDFLMTELQGPEARAAKSILGAEDVSGAATAIARDFLRPAPENLQKRVAKYGGAGGAQMQPTISTQGSMGSAAPMQAEDQPKWKNKDLWANLAIAFNSMRMRPDAGLAQAMRSGIESRASERKASQSRNKTADWLESQGAVDLAAGVRGGAVPAQVALQMAMQKPKAQSPYSSIGKLQADLAAGRISQEQYDVALQNMAPSGMSIESTPDGGFRLVQGVGAGVKLTEGQGKATGFYNRAQKSEKVLSELERAGTSLYESIVQNVPLAGNYMVSEEYQKYSQAKRDFINAILRQESGAVIGADEFSNAEKQYFPQPGDSPAVIEQKRQNRAAAIEGLKVASGPGAGQVGGSGDADKTGSGGDFSVTGRID